MPHIMFVVADGAHDVHGDQAAPAGRACAPARSRGERLQVGGVDACPGVGFRARFAVSAIRSGWCRRRSTEEIVPTAPRPATAPARPPGGNADAHAALHDGKQRLARELPWAQARVAAQCVQPRGYSRGVIPTRDYPNVLQKMPWPGATAGGYRSRRVPSLLCIKKDRLCRASGRTRSAVSSAGYGRLAPARATVPAANPRPPA